MHDKSGQPLHNPANQISSINRELENAHILINILSIVANDNSLDVLLEKAIDELLSISWLNILPKGGVFIADESEQTLHLIAKKNLAPELHTLCARIPFGHCLCGRAAASQEVQYAQCVDDRHDVSFDGISPHGHYNIPLCLGKKLLGVLVVYLPHGHKKNDQEIDFLVNIGKTLSLLIQVKEKESALNKSKDDLQSYLVDLDIQNAALQKQAEDLVILSEEQHELRSQAEILEQKALYASRHDPLTQLPNRNYFTQRCRDAIAKPTGSNKVSAILFIDIDGFKSINDQLGHGAGDELLVQISGRLRDNIREKDIAARFGGDEFILFIQGLPSVQQGENTAQNIVSILSEPYALKAGSAMIGASCGISIFPDHSEQIETLIDIADQAMYTIKLNGKNGIFVAEQK